MLQSYFLTRDHFYICDKFAHGPMEKDKVYLRGYVSRLVCDEMAVSFAKATHILQQKYLWIRYCSF